MGRSWSIRSYWLQRHWWRAVQTTTSRSTRRRRRRRTGGVTGDVEFVGGLWIDRVEHEAFIDVDDDGTRAVAATGGVMAVSHGPTVEVNRPYLYVIRGRRFE